MTAAETWVPGDPFLPDNGCGPMTSVTLTEDQRAAVIAEGDLPPQWWRPDPEPAPPGSGAWTRYCKPCDVGWRGPEPCWSCGKEYKP